MFSEMRWWVIAQWITHLDRTWEMEVVGAETDPSLPETLTCDENEVTG